MVGQPRATKRRSSKASKPNAEAAALKAERPHRGEKDGAPNLVVGIGASAGGIDAFKAFFSTMPVDTGMTFVIVQHLDPHHLSSLVSIVGSFTGMTVRNVEHGTQVVRDHVYVIPPDAILTIEKGKLLLAQPALPAERRTSINTFLSSLARDQGDNAVGIILSGFGSDGALGMASIKEGGGLTLSQADFDHHAKMGMPQNAASGGFVDHVLPVEKMPAALLNYQHHRSVFEATKGPDGIKQDFSSFLPRVCSILHSRLGRDFSQYKAGTLMRRIQRRMHVLQIADVAAYVERLRATDEEAEHLFREFIISVTRFFRDPDAFAALEGTITSWVTGDAAADPIRVWVAGCATGEEAYSVAILLREALRRAESQRAVQIFATDIDEHAIQVARAGLYDETIASFLSAERLKQNFVREGRGYQVLRQIRDMCVFSTHDLVNNPPFSKLDLLCCRNLLIYFEPALQHQVMTTFHYALLPGGRFFLDRRKALRRNLGCSGRSINGTGFSRGGKPPRASQLFHCPDRPRLPTIGDNPPTAATSWTAGHRASSPATHPPIWLWISITRCSGSRDKPRDISSRPAVRQASIFFLFCTPISGRLFAPR